MKISLRKVTLSVPVGRKHVGGKQNIRGLFLDTPEIIRKVHRRKSVVVRPISDVLICI